MVWKVITVIGMLAGFLIGRIELAGEYKGKVDTHDRELYGLTGRDGLVEKVETLKIQQATTDARYEKIMETLSDLKKTIEASERRSRRLNGSD